eukprot:15440974-Alexandrium_andersonii.AAC.1
MSAAMYCVVVVRCVMCVVSAVLRAACRALFPADLCARWCALLCSSQSRVSAWFGARKVRCSCAVRSSLYAL